MNRKFYSRITFFAAALTASVSAQAALEEVTTQYIPNAGFEDCATATILDGVAQLIAADKTAVDYADDGWTFIGPGKLNGNASSSFNAGVATYPVKVKYSKWLNGVDGPAASPTEGDNANALCFTGNLSAIYQQTEAVTLPAGTYVFTVHVYAYNGGTTNPSPTINTNNFTGFVTNDGAEFLSEKKNFLSSQWDTDVIKIELTEATAGRFQLSYGASYFVAIDDLKLEYEGGVITTDVETAIERAETMNGILGGDETLEAAIDAAKAFVADPTSQDDVPAEAERLYAAIGAALTANEGTEPINITAAFLQNPSFETGKVEPWEGTAYVTEPILSSNIDGQHMAGFEYDAPSYKLSQLADHLPAGYYLFDVLLRDRARLVLGTTEQAWQGGADGLYLRSHSQVANTTETGSLIVGARGTYDFSVDNFRLFYAKDAEALLQMELSAVKADASGLLADEAYSSVVGAERAAVAETTEAEGEEADEQIRAIHSALLAFVAAKDDYVRLSAAKNNAALLSREAFPYAKTEIYEQLDSLMNVDVTSAAHAQKLTEELNNAGFALYVSNAWCEGVDGRVDYTEKIVAANATGEYVNASWRKLNMDIRTTDKTWTNPMTGDTDGTVYGVTMDYYRTGAGQEAYMWQTISGLPKGKYVLSVTCMMTASLHPEVLVNGQKIGELTGVGTYGGGRYGAGWVDNTFEFEKADDEPIELRLQSVLPANYQEWYFDNLRLYGLGGEEGGEEGGEVGIASITSSTAKAVFDLQGRRVAQPVKGLYIVDGKKVVK